MVAASMQPAAKFGGLRADWIDLSTGINPVPYPLPQISRQSWTALPDKAATDALENAARQFWNVPDDAALLAAPGASALIARIPDLAPNGIVEIPTPTYNEHAAAFTAGGWQLGEKGATAKVIVHPNNPTGRWYGEEDLTADLTVIDESFGDVDPGRSLISATVTPGRIVLKSFGKFWGLAGLRLGFAIGPHELIETLAQMLGPWPVSGPAQAIATLALNDPDWAEATRERLLRDCTRLDALMTRAGAEVAGGTSLFRLYRVTDASDWQERLARQHIWARIFPYSKNLIRLGLPAPDDWLRVEAAI